MKDKGNEKVNESIGPYDHVCVDLTENEIREKYAVGHQLIAAKTGPVYTYTYWVINENLQKVYVLISPDGDLRTVHRTITGAMKEAGVPFYGPIDDHVQKSWHELTTDGKGNIRKDPWLNACVNTFVIYEEDLLL